MDQVQELIQFIRTTFQKPEAFIPLHEPTFNGKEKEYLNECIDSTFVSSVGKFVDLFEEKIAAFTGAKHAVVTVNGTAAIQISLLAAGVKTGDEVITQPLTFISTANAINYCNATPVFLDVDKDTLGLSPAALKSFLEKETTQKDGYCVNKRTGKKITACVPMHTFGHSARIDEIVALCKQHRIVVVEDAAESLGSYYKDQHTGTFGKLGAISFNGNKVMTTGGGGMILTDDEALAKKIKHMTTQAKVPHAWEYVHDQIGYNYRMPNINAALGCAQLEQLPRFIERKRKLAQDYRIFCEKAGLQFVVEPKDTKSNYWLNAVILNDRVARDVFLKKTNENKVMTRPIWELMNRLPMYEHCQTDGLENAMWLADRVVNLPSTVIL
jgi:aminotransferase in exopolysaccharide biosynthesis